MNPRYQIDLLPLADRGPMRVLFAVTSMPVGGAETLLMNLVRRLDRGRFQPEIACLKELGPLGESLTNEIPMHTELLSNKWDLRVLARLRRLIRDRRIDALISVGAGDKMFWGRLVARLEKVPVICAALHSTGWPDGIGFLNRRLTPITDAFIAVARDHGRHLVEVEGFPLDKVCIIPNGIDTRIFRPHPECRSAIRHELGIPEQARVAGIVAALRPEKNHSLFLRAAAQIRSKYPDSHFLIIGDGPERAHLERLAHSLDLTSSVRFLGTRPDVAKVLSAMDVFALTSHNEANPVSILEALACGLPVVATRVGSVHEAVIPGQTGFLVNPGQADEVAARIAELFENAELRQNMGASGRNLVESHGSLECMVRGYEQLLTRIYESKCKFPNGPKMLDVAEVARLQSN